jgi:hypothetical protein
MAIGIRGCGSRELSAVDVHQCDPDRAGHFVTNAREERFAIAMEFLFPVSQITPG